MGGVVKFYILYLYILEVYNLVKKIKSDTLGPENPTAFYSEKQKEKLIREHLKKLTNIFDTIDIDKNKRDIAQPLIEQAAFMSVELADLKEQIKRDGCVEFYQNGANQKGRKRSAAVDVYNTMIKNYTSVTKQLIDLIPKSDLLADDGFDDFLNESD